MSKITIKKISITDITADAIVNAANSYLAPGGGVCGAIYEKAGYEQLLAACRKIGRCKTGDAVITDGFQTNAKYIIHAVGPIWSGGNDKEPELLYGCYKASLQLARENQCRSVAFPLISAGIYGYPQDQAWRVALQACDDFLKDNPEYDIDIIFTILSDRIIQSGYNAMQVLDIPVD